MKKYFATLIFSLLLGLTSLTVFAAVNTTTEPTAGDTIYIAGNPDLYPFEYYDEDSDTYKGMLPEFYAEFSEQNGIDMTYVYAGKKNHQKKLVANTQVELVSAFTGEPSDLVDCYTVFTYEKDGETCSLQIGFTPIMPEQTKTLILEKIKAKTSEEWLSSSFAVTTIPQQVTPWSWYILINGFVMVVAIILFLIVRNKRQKSAAQSKQIDPLTGIGNLEYLKYSYNHYLPASIHYLYYVAYISLNTEYFEKYLGTAELENAQHFAANILSTEIGDTDFVARIADGVFVLFFQGLDDERASTRIEEILQILNDNKKKYLFRAGICHLGKAKTTLETMIFNAHQGYNYAVEKRKLYCISTKEVIDYTALKTRLRQKLISAVENDEFELFLQFIVNHNGDIVAAEALSRWNSREEGLLTPRHYIDDMIKLGLIDRLDFCILEKACKQLSEWNTEAYKHLSISCNFTRITISTPDFMTRFHSIVNNYHFDHRRLIIELTEDSLSDNMALAYQNVLACKKDGFRIALDDLGSGYSSLSDLCDYPIDIIKIDRHIVAKSSTDRGSLLLRGLITLAHDLGVKVLCEGVETIEENQRVLNNGCDFIQGFYYSRVMPKNNAMDFYENYQKEEEYCM